MNKEQKRKELDPKQNGMIANFFDSLDIVILTLMIDDLKCFDFPEFTAEFLWNMMKELPALLYLASNFEYNFEEEDPDGTKHTNRILSRARRARKRVILKKNTGTNRTQ